jgi:hypothetical protein
MLQAIKEKKFVKRLITKLLESHALVHAENSDLQGVALYRAVLLHSGVVDAEIVDQVLWQAEDSVDDWTARSTKHLQFRQVVYFVAIRQFLAQDNPGTVISMRDIIYSMVPEQL